MPSECTIAAHFAVQFNSTVYTNLSLPLAMIWMKMLQVWQEDERSLAGRVRHVSQVLSHDVFGSAAEQCAQEDETLRMASGL